MRNCKLTAVFFVCFLAFFSIIARPFAQDRSLTADELTSLRTQVEVLGEILDLYLTDMLDPPTDIGSCLQEMMAMRLLGKCRDKFSYYIPREEVTAWTEDLGGEFGGVGLEITQKDGRVLVVAPLENTPGDRAGFKPEDVILAVDGKDVDNVQQAARLIRGLAGSKVEIKYWRKDFSEPKTIVIVREKIIVQLVKVRDISLAGQKIKVIKVNSFGDKTYTQFKEALDLAKRKGIKSVVLDLRNNPGGLLSQTLRMSALFMRSEDTALTYRTRKESLKYDAFYLTKMYGIRRFGEFRDLKIVILINKGSASASEVFSGAMKDWGFVVIGEKSFGKGVGQECKPLSDGAILCLTTFEFLVGNNKTPIRDIGVIPNIEVKKSDDKDKDEQLDRALEILTK